ncbi:uncharacterized protein LOC117169199 isoform X2 [Belonocnema kinseyi]|uniref:uncharacterized protein LOC117169199 isoform X2 n=1 Tax=Belonocnema kinseyi TaxID=2817044 RepID=UPI00143D761E|nr:uncharacterized protein LOC117169199 isoform X2 [Belonocnema kinseyi]
MLGRGKACSRAASATALAVPTNEQPTVEGGFAQSLYQNSNRFNPDTVLPGAGINVQVEWIEPDSLDAEVSGLVTSLPTSQNPKRCYRTSTSSGYSSHSPPLSATSYSCCNSATPQQGAVGVTVTNTIRDQRPGLPVIHEGETIPRPIWPCIGSNPTKIHHEGCLEHNADGKGIPCCCYGYTDPHPYDEWECGKTSGTMAQEVLLELSRTLNSVLEGDTSMTPEEILRDISRTITQGVDVNKKTLFEDYIYRNSSTSSGGKDSFSTEMNPINSRVYGKTETYLGLQNPSWSRSHCHHAKNSPSQDLLTTSYGKQTNPRFEDDQNRKESSSGVLVVPENEGFFSRNIHCYNTKNSKICSCRRSDNSNRVSNFKQKDNGKESDRINNEKEQCNLRKEYPSANHEYATLDCGEEGSSSGDISRSSSKDSWCREAGIFEKSLNFTLDGSRAERLRRAIEEAKRRRQWCRAITTLFGLIFFVLSVVIVSLSVTKGRKVFGSM